MLNTNENFCTSAMPMSVCTMYVQKKIADTSFKQKISIYTFEQQYKRNLSILTTFSIKYFCKCFDKLF